MKIAILCNGFQYDGGMETYTLDLVQGLLPFLSEPPIIITKKFDPKLDLINKVKLFKITMGYVPSCLRDIYFSWRAKQILKTNKVDFVIGCCRNTINDIVMCGGNRKGFSLSKGSKTLKDVRIEKTEEKQIKAANLIIAHSDLMREELINLYGIPEKKVRTIYPPVSFNKFSPVSKSKKMKIRRELGLSENDIYFLFVSSSHVRKGYTLLKDYFTQTELPIKLLVVGKPINEESNKIKYLGKTSHIEKLYQAVDYTILASKYEPFGLAPLESLSCHTPVVISDKLGCKDVISEEWKYIFKSDNLLSLDKAIRKALRESKTAHEKQIVSSPFLTDLTVENHVKTVLNELKKLKDC